MAIVNIWYPTLRSVTDIRREGIDTSSPSAKAYSFVENVGHASLVLDGVDPGEYVSWCPNKGHTAFATPTYDEDVALESAEPSARVALSCLQETYIRSWWHRVRLDGSAIPYREDYFPKDDKWTLERTNCSHMVWMALKIGGAERNATLFRWGAEIVTPAQVHAYALRIKAAAALARSLR